MTIGTYVLQSMKTSSTENTLTYKYLIVGFVELNLSAKCFKIIQVLELNSILDNVQYFSNDGINYSNL